VNWSFRNRLQIFAAVLTSFGVGILAIFFLQLYQNDKFMTLVDNERVNSQRSASSLLALVNLARVIDLDKIGESQQIILVADEVCNSKSSPKVMVSKAHEQLLSRLQLNASSWINSLDVFLGCKRLREGVDEQGRKTSPMQLMPFQVQLMVPYLGLLMGDGSHSRLALISMEEFQILPGSTLFLMNARGKLLWSADSADFVGHALEDTRISQDLLASIATETSPKTPSLVREAGDNGLVAISRVTQDWFVASLSYIPMINRGVSYAYQQFAVLLIGVLCAGLLVGRSMARVLIRPLEELRTSAEVIGSGKLDFRFRVHGDDEFSVVKRSFNSMIEKILELLQDSKTKATLEGELSLTRQVQVMLFPKPQVALEHTRLSAYVDFADHCGGDWWGYLDATDPEGKPVTIVMIGDVTGHGAPSALMTAAMRGAVSVLSKWIETDPKLALDPARLMKLLNTAICESGKRSMNMTFLICVLDHTRKRILFTNAAHVSGYLIAPEGNGVYKIKPVGSASLTLGDNPDAEYSIEMIDWVPGAKLFLYTDGLVDVPAGGQNLFDRKSLRKIIQANQAASARVLLARVIEQRARVAKGLPKVDDIAVVVCESIESHAQA
jgi:sigma-B regulation protein RsbU (phosphoserine phosphatase)